MGKTHLVIPDSHSVYGHNSRRYEWLGHLINDIKPDVCIDIGDWYDMPSLNSYDKSAKKAYEGRQYSKDIEAGIEGQDRLLSIVRRSKRKLPRFVRTLGNHEQRIVKAIEADPVLEGTIGLSDLQSKQYGWEEYPFLQPVEIDGVHYCHYFVTGVSGRPVSGDSTARMLLAKQFKSSTQGHSHLYDHAVRTDANGNKLNGLTVGCYLEQNLEWADSTAPLWWKGVVVCRNVDNGSYDLQQISLEALKKAYGNVGR